MYTYRYMYMYMYMHTYITNAWHTRQTSDQSLAAGNVSINEITPFCSWAKKNGPFLATWLERRLWESRSTALRSAPFPATLITISCKFSCGHLLSAALPRKLLPLCVFSIHASGNRSARETRQADHLVAHPTDRKWVTTLVIDGISGGNVHL